MSKKIAIAGGSGMIGKKLSKRLTDLGYQVHILTRKPSRKVNENLSYVNWNPADSDLPRELLDQMNVIINLAGRSVADKRFTTSFKEELLQSRTNPTLELVKYLNLGTSVCDTFLNASAIGYYGYDRGEEILDEDADPGSDFFGNLCSQWENASADLSDSIRRVIFRIGVVFDANEGAYKRLKMPIMLGAGSALGSGKQYMSWIHIQDLINMFIYAIQNHSVSGIYNATAPKPARNRKVVGSIADSLNKVILLPKVPGFALRLLLGEFAESILGSVCCSSQKIQDEGFIFSYSHIDEATRNLDWGK